MKISVILAHPDPGSFNHAIANAVVDKLQFGDPLEAIWKKRIFELCGVRTVDRRVFRVVVKSTPAERDGCPWKAANPKKW